MEEKSQEKINKLRQRVRDYLFVEEQNMADKRDFVIRNLFDSSSDYETQSVSTCVVELVGEIDLNLICSDPELIDKFRDCIKTNKSNEAMAREL